MSDSVTPRTATRQASLSFTNSWSLLKFMSTESVMASNHLIYANLLVCLAFDVKVRLLSISHGWQLFYKADLKEWVWFPGSSVVKNLPTMQETWVWSLGRKDLLEKEMATHSSILAWKILWAEEPGGLQCIGLQRVRHDWVTNIHSDISSPALQPLACLTTVWKMAGGM